MKTKSKFIVLKCRICQKELIYINNISNPKCGDCINQEIMQKHKKRRKYNFND